MRDFKEENLNTALLIVEATYTKMMSERQEYKEFNKIILLQTIFPPYWHNSSDYPLKIKLLGKAIKDKRNLKDFPEIIAFEEGVVTEKTS